MCVYLHSQRYTSRQNMPQMKSENHNRNYSGTWKWLSNKISILLYKYKKTTSFFLNNSSIPVSLRALQITTRLWNTTWFIVFPAKWTERLSVNQHIQLQLNRENEWTVYRSGRETRTRREGKRWSSEKTKKRLTIRERERLVRGWLTSTFLNWLTSTWLAFPNLYFLLMEQYLPLKPKKHQGPVPDLWKLAWMA